MTKLMPAMQRPGEVHSRERGQLVQKTCCGDDLGMFQEEKEDYIRFSSLMKPEEWGQKEAGSTVY